MACHFSDLEIVKDPIVQIYYYSNQKYGEWQKCEHAILNLVEPRRQESHMLILIMIDRGIYAEPYTIRDHMENKSHDHGQNYKVGTLHFLEDLDPKHAKTEGN